MDGTDLQRRIGGARKLHGPAEGLAALWRSQRPPEGGSAADCLKVARDPGRRLEPLRRGMGLRRGLLRREGRGG